MLRTRIVLAAAALLVLLAFGAGDLLAKRPPPDPEPPADPAIAYLDSGDLMVMNADGTNRTIILSGGSIDIGRPDWSPDGTQLVFASDVWGAGIYVINVDGTGLAKLIDLNYALGGNPVWSPAPVPGVGGDRHRIAYSDKAAPDAYQDVYLIDTDGEDKVRLTETSDHYETMPTWSPSGKKLAVTVLAGQPVQTDLWALIDLEAGTCELRRHQGSLEGASVSAPEWSRTDESRIAWRVFLDGEHCDVWIVDLDAVDEPVNLTSTPELEERFPSWSPDDTRIVFDSSQSRNGRLRSTGIEVMASDGSSRVRIQSGGVAPRWRR